MSKLRFEFETEAHRGALERLSMRLSGTAYADWPLRWHWNSLPGAPSGDRFPVRRRRLLAVIGSEVRGHQNFFEHELWIAGRLKSFVWPNGGLSESVVNPSFAFIGLALMRETLRQEPWHLAVAHLPLDKPPGNMLARMGWRAVQVPNFLLPLRADRVIRVLAAPRLPRTLRPFVGPIAASGFPQAALNLWRRLPGRLQAARLTIDVSPLFGKWADEVWITSRDCYCALTRRDAATLNRLYAAGDNRLWRCSVRRDGALIGWVLLTLRQDGPAETFGPLRIGIIVDALGRPENVPALLAASVWFLEAHGADAVYASWSHAAFQAASCRLGCYRWVSSYRLFVSPAAAEFLLTPERPLKALHFSRGDCDGPTWELPDAPLPD